MSYNVIRMKKERKQEGTKREGREMLTKTEKAIAIVAQLHNIPMAHVIVNRTVKRLARKPLHELNDMYEMAEAARVSMNKPREGSTI